MKLLNFILLLVFPLVAFQIFGGFFAKLKIQFWMFVLRRLLGVTVECHQRALSIGKKFTTTI